MFEPMGLVDEQLRWLENGVNRLWGGWARKESHPPLDVWEDADQVIVETEVPGLEAGDFEISVAGSRLSIRGERKARAVEGGELLRRERPWGAFERIVELSVGLQADQVEATLDRGVLRIRLPKVAAARPRRIEVKTGAGA